MAHIVLPNGYYLSMPHGNFHVSPMGNTKCYMQTIAETRRARLEILIKRHDGKIANLNEALGLPRNDTKLARLRNANARTDRPGKLFNMGDPQARQIEELLKLERGWMDTPPSYAELHGEEDPRAKVLALMEKMPPAQWPTAARLLDALAQPAPGGNGTTG